MQNTGAGAYTIRGDSFLTLHYRLTRDDGVELVSTFDGAPATLSLGGGQLAPALEQRLLGLGEGVQAVFELAPDEAYGERNPTLVQRVSLALLRELGDPDARYALGDAVQFPGPDGQAGYAGIVCELGPPDEGWLRFDFNHPLAGRALRFEVRVIGVIQ